MPDTDSQHRTSAQSASSDLGLYAHVPFCKHECPYCDFYKFAIKSRPARQRIDFSHNLFHELQLSLNIEPELYNRPWKTLYFGGGTPGILPAKQLGLSLESFWSYPQTKDVSEVTLEVNPENITGSNVKAWKNMGITRLSVGVQSFHDDELSRLERLHDRKTLLQSLERLAGEFENYSIDLMYSLPDQSLDRFLENLKRAVQFNPKHISFYGLTIHGGTPFEVEHQKGNLKLPKDSQQAAMFLEGHDYLVSQGFGHYEVSNYAKAGFESQHNQRYWNREDVIGFGPGAWSNIGLDRWANVENIDQWEQSLAGGQLSRTQQETLSQSQAEEERLLSGFRTCKGVNISHLVHLKQSVLNWLKSSVAAQLVEEGYMIQNADNITLTPKGWLISNSILQSLTNAFEREA